MLLRATAATHHLIATIRMPRHYTRRVTAWRDLIVRTIGDLKYNDAEHLLCATGVGGYVLLTNTSPAHVPYVHVQPVLCI